MKHHKVLVLGYFGFEDNQLDGQTIKTRNIYKLLEIKSATNFENISYFDTQTFKTSKLNFLKLFKIIARNNVLVYLPAHNNFKYIFPILFLFCKLMRIDIHYVVVGGWLAEFLENKPIHKWMLSHIKGIYPQTAQLVKDLCEDYNLNNVYQLNNFRLIDVPNYEVKPSEKTRLVFMARVHPRKGVNTVFKLGEQLNIYKIKNVEIDIYGPIYHEYTEEFNTQIENQSLVSYKGVLQPDEIYKVLMEYDLMLFPTQYYTEGFPGSILDSYLSQVPVIATKWKYAEEFIEHQVSGIIVKFGDEEEFISETLKLIQNPYDLEQLKIGAINQSRKYSSERAWSTLKEVM